MYLPHRNFSPALQTVYSLSRIHHRNCCCLGIICNSWNYLVNVRSSNFPCYFVSFISDLAGPNNSFQYLDVSVLGKVKINAAKTQKWVSSVVLSSSGVILCGSKLSYKRENKLYEARLLHSMQNTTKIFHATVIKVCKKLS